MNNQILSKIKKERLKRAEAAEQIGISTMHLYNAIHGKPMGRNAAKKIRKWLDNKVTIAELMKV